MGQLTTLTFQQRGQPVSGSVCVGVYVMECMWRTRCTCLRVSQNVYSDCIAAEVQLAVMMNMEKQVQGHKNKVTGESGQVSG